MIPHKPEIADAASERDRKWFARHPGRSTYIRMFMPGELPQEREWVGGGVHAMIVRQITPGARVRIPTYLRRMPEDTEAAAVATLRGLMGAAR